MSTVDRPASPELRGDEQELFELYAERLERSVTSAVMAPAHIIEEACAFAWFQLVRTQPERSHTFPWLHVVARREAIRLAKLAERDASFDELVDGDRSAGIDVGAMQSHNVGVEQQVHLAEVMSGLHEMPERRQRIFVAHLAGMSYDEIAGMTGTTTRTVQRQILKARTTLRRQFA